MAFRGLSLENLANQADGSLNGAPAKNRTQEIFTTSATPFNKGHHRFAVLTACWVFGLIIFGALVTSNDAGLSVPDWPTSFGSLYRIPPLNGGVFYEHIHRMIAQGAGLLTIILAVWTQKVDRRGWMRKLGWTALGLVIAQGILGGLTVLFYLPPWISAAHATLAQTYFCVMVSLALFTSREFIQRPPLHLPQNERPQLTTLAYASVGAVWLQLLFGAAFRHNGMKIMWHLAWFVVVFTVLMWTMMRVLRAYREVAELRRPVFWLMGLLTLQILLGFGAFVTRVVMSPSSPEPMTSLVVTTVAHVAVGALVLANTVVLAIEARRHLAVTNEEAVETTGKALVA
jgi:heme a synthase